MAKLVFGMNVSLDGYVDHMSFAPSPTLFRHFIEEAQGQAAESTVISRARWRDRSLGRVWRKASPYVANRRRVCPARIGRVDHGLGGRIQFHQALRSSAVEMFARPLAVGR